MKKPQRSPDSSAPYPFAPSTIAVQAALLGLLALAGTPVQAQTAPAAQDATTALPAVTVKAGAPDEKADGPVVGFVARRSATATKTDTPLIETARAVSVVTREQMDIQGVQTIEQALRYTAGINTETNGFDTRHESMVARGFDVDQVYVDGLRTFKTGSYGNWIAEEQGLERVELIKGPASVLYGQGSPGGLVNLVTKKPSLDALNEVTVSVGSHQRHEAGFDLNGKLGDDGSVLFRINGLGRDSKTQFDFGKDKRLYLAPSLSWSPSAATTVTFLLDVIQDRMMPKSWYPQGYLTLDPDMRGGPRPGRKLYTGEPGFDHYDRDASSLTYLLAHRFDDTWTFKQSVRLSTYKLDYRHVYANNVDIDSDGTTVLTRRALVTRTDSDTVTIDNHAQATFSAGGLAHKLLLGVDYQQFSGDEDQSFSGGSSNDVPNLNPYRPVYGGGFTVPDFTHVAKRLGQLGFYAQDRLHRDRVFVNLGLRRDHASTRSSASDAATGAFIGETRTRDSKTTYNADVLYKTDIGLYPYISHATSFMPNLETRNSEDLTPFKPETARQFELGVKFQPQGSSGYFTAAVFDVLKKNVTAPSPDNSGDQVQTGEVRSRGVELEGVASLSRRLDLIASYTYLDSEVTQSDDPALLGQPYQGTARNTAKVWLDYKVRGWTFGAGLRHVGKMAAGTDVISNEPYHDPSYTLVDAAARYTLGPVTMSLSASNLFDKVTVVGNQFYSQGRALKATVGYRW